VTSPNLSKKNDISYLDSITNGVFSAPTAGERAARTKEWLARNPNQEQLAEVFKELSVKDKGAAKLVRELLDEAKRTKGQALLSADWAAKAQALLALTKVNIADAMAWQRDAAKAGAPLSKEPLASLKTLLAERIRSIEDLQHQVQIQREAAVLLAQRIEVLSTKSWVDAQLAGPSLKTDVMHWQLQAKELTSHTSWESVDLKFPPLLEASRSQLLVVWDAFEGALTLAIAAGADPAATLPPVRVWADEIRIARGLPLETVAKPTKPVVDPEVRAQATLVITETLAKLEAEMAKGHGKASAGAASALRQALKESAKLIDSKLEGQANAALAAAGELEGWQRWRADQLREELVNKAEALLKRPAGQEIGGRKMQENLRTLRDQWKETDQGGVPNHVLWRRFDAACNEAYKVVEAWLEKIKADAAQNKAQRLELIEEMNAWALENRTARDGDWKGFHRILHQFAERWRNSGQVSDKVFAELQVLWKQAIDQAAAPLEALQSESLVVRQSMIEESKQLGEAPVLRIDSVRALQQRWQVEVHRVPLERRQEQKLWDAFRKPIDEAFNRKTAEREKAEIALNSRDRVVLQASKALEAANQSGDAKSIRDAMAVLDAALKGQAQAQELMQTTSAELANQAAVQADPAQPSVELAQGNQAEGVASDNAMDSAPELSTEAVTPVLPRPVHKPVVAVRGDDRPGMKKDAPAEGRSGAKPATSRDGQRKDGARNSRDSKNGSNAANGREGARATAWQPEAPRLGDTAFRAQREALENAQHALKNIAAQAHGEALTQLLQAWEKKEASLIPKTQDLGNKNSQSFRALWQQAIEGKKSFSESPSDALLRLEIASEVPTPAEHLNGRRALQLQLLTRRNAPTPLETWGTDAAVVFANAFDAPNARRLQTVLKVLLKRG
jgi:hypothetical protein